ncbi:MAG: ABC transporter permease [Planctomycetes bacterium]|nr:ABC transporter permease [Planctomycetota bacterium]
MPSEMGPTGLDPSMGLLAGYLLGVLGGLNLLALGLGFITLPVFFILLYAVEQVSLAISNATGWFPAKLVLYMFRGLRRSPLRTSLTYIALFVLTLVLSMIYSVLVFIGRVTTEKEADFKAITTHKTIIPSQMPRAHYEQFKRELAKLPDGMRPKNGEADLMAWSFFLGTTDPISKRPDSNVFAFCIEPRKILTMMDGLDDLTGKEKADLDAAVAEMERDKQAIVMSKMRMKKMNLQVGQTIKVTGLNYTDLVFDLRIIGELPDGKYDNISFINSAYLFSQLDAWKLNNPKNRTSEPHPMDAKCINLIWVRLPNKEAFERLAAAVNDTGNFSNPQIKLETASSGFGTFLEAFKDILFGMKYLMAPAMVAIMCLVIANAISIGVRERRTEMAVLKVLGFQPRHVLFLVVGEAVLVGLMAGFMSTLIAFKMIGNLKLQIAFFGAFFVPGEVLLYGPMLGAFVAVAGSIAPALNAKNVKVAEVFSKVA